MSFAGDIAVRPDGRILVAGMTSDSFSLMQYLPDGQLDPGFGNRGITTTSLGDDAKAMAQAMALQSDGKVVLVGSYDTNSPAQDDIALVRYLPGGGLDPSFGQGGIVRCDLGGWETASAIAWLPDGRLVVAGWQDAGDERRAIVARFLMDGRPDPTFDGNGERILPLAVGAMIFDLSVGPDGAVTLVGQGGIADPSHYAQDILLIRLQSDGSFDPSFGDQGVLQTDLGTILDSGTAIARQPDGKLVVVGTRGLNRQIVALRYEPNGRLDDDFGATGVVIVDLIDDVVWEYPNDVLLQANGSIVVAGGSYSTATQWDTLVLRLTPDGDLDTRFGDNGRAVMDLERNDDVAQALALQSDGAIIAAFQTDLRLGVARILNDPGYLSHCWLPALARP